MNQVLVEVAVVTNITDWVTGHKKEEKIQILVDEDVAHVARTFKLRDLSKIERNSKDRVHKPSYILHVVGSQSMVGSGATSIGEYLYNIPAGTRRKNKLEANNYTRDAYNVKVA